MGGARPTVAQLKAAESAVKQACDETDRAHGERLKALAEAETARRALNELRETAVPEATALAGCIKAIDEMRSLQRPSSVNAGYSYGQTSLRPFGAGDSEVGRILLHLAARYGVPITAIEPDPEPEPCGACGRHF